jgi:UDP-N-acetylmuramoyl-L-alanyl-D-glutamate--2,6-diaminopimelate ligase
MSDARLPRIARVFRPEWLASLGAPIERLCNDSRTVRPGDVFVAYPGLNRDGRDFIGRAIESGARAVIWEAQGFEWRAHWNVPNLQVEGLRAVAGEIAAHVAGYPADAMWMVGITGTNGKSSCSHWIAQALSALGRPCAVIGTLGHGFPDALTGLINTTPDALALHELLARYRDAGARCVAMEVSSHGLTQDRLSGVRFDVALFTNLTRDHLDYHGDMESYGEAKAKLFDWPGLKSAVINVDDAFGKRLVARLSARSVDVFTYGLAGGAISGHCLDLDRFGLDLEIRTPWGGGPVRSTLLGAYNAANLLGVLGVLLASDVPFDRALATLPRLEAVSGRMQAVSSAHGPRVVVDYAHTPDALEQALRALRSHMAGDKLVCVFGCGGERDPGKRPLMGEIATRLADRVFITSDNPRNEDPGAIIEAIAAGARPPYVIELDRARAIESAIKAASSSDLVLIAGKGHESYQDIAGVRHPFSDVAIAEAALAHWPQAAAPGGAGRGTPS